MTKEKFKELFINLTKYTIPFKHEYKLEKYLPAGFKKDKFGNYYYEIGDSETLFTSHLDTYSENFEEVNHVIDDEDEYKIGTDGSTILGGDNKLGTSILIGMIQNRIPGTYYFFLGEEPIVSGGLWGSSLAIRNNTQYFKKFKRCIAFDRRAYGSIVVRQKGRMCSSPEFAKAIASEFNSKGIKWDEESGFGYYTDSAVFMDTIEECTNISAGGFNEHYKNEWVDLNYTYNVYQTALSLNWEKLPTVREIEDDRLFHDDKKIDKFNIFKNASNVQTINDIFDILGMGLTRDKIEDHATRHITFSEWLDDFDYHVYFKDGKVSNDNVIFMDFDKFRDELFEEFKEDIKGEIKYLIKKIEEDDNSNEHKKHLRNLAFIFGYKKLDGDIYECIIYLDSLIKKYT